MSGHPSLHARRLTVATASVVGAAVPAGKKASTVRLLPGLPERGVLFARPAVAPGMQVPVSLEATCYLEDGRLALSHEGRPFAYGLEALMSATLGLGVNDLVVELDGPEMPCADDPAAYVEAILDAGLSLGAPGTDFFEVRRAVRVEREGGAWVEIRPSRARRLDVVETGPLPDGVSVATQDFGEQSFLSSICSDPALAYRSRRTWEAMGTLAMVGVPLLGHVVAKDGDGPLVNAAIRTLFKAGGGCVRRRCGDGRIPANESACGFRRAV